jgi:murein DD-endopeptidase MepM/ murein hydrolase activator NlpD
VALCAERGLKIKATGDGVVVQQGTMGGYGQTITLQHGSRYTTLYGHMSDFASHTSVGEHVQQGQVIGYIGSTGLATGPHLHYEFRINGVHHNPVTVTLPAARALPKAEMATFLSATQPLRAELDGFARHRFAMN